jgi:hypothetical protein
MHLDQLPIVSSLLQQCKYILEKLLRLPQVLRLHVLLVELRIRQIEKRIPREKLAQFHNASFHSRDHPLLLAGGGDNERQFVIGARASDSTRPPIHIVPSQPRGLVDRVSVDLLILRPLDRAYGPGREVPPRGTKCWLKAVEARSSG